MKKVRFAASKNAIEGDMKAITYEECNYCCNNGVVSDYLVHNGDNGIYIDEYGYLENDLKETLFNKVLNYCPMCGRKFN